MGGGRINLINSILNLFQDLTNEVPEMNSGRASL